MSSVGRIVDGLDVPYRSRLGSRGLSGLKAFLLGSVSDRGGHHARCPVLVVK